MIIIFAGVASSFLVLPPHRVVRGDGTVVKLDDKSKVHEEVVAMLRTLKDWRMFALLPMFFASNYFYAYQGAVNAAVFDGPTRALNATLEGAGAIVGGNVDMSATGPISPLYAKFSRSWSAVAPAAPPAPLPLPLACPFT